MITTKIELPAVADKRDSIKLPVSQENSLPEKTPEKVPTPVAPLLTDKTKNAEQRSGKRVEDIISEKEKELEPILKRTGEKKPRKNHKKKGGSVRKSKDKRKSRRRGSTANSMISSNIIQVDGFIKHRADEAES